MGGGAEGQLQKGGAGQEDAAGDGVVGQPRVAGQGDRAAELETFAFGAFDQGREERVARLGLAERAGVGRARAGRDPVAAALEGVGGQGDALGAAAL